MSVCKKVNPAKDKKGTENSWHKGQNEGGWYFFKKLEQIERLLVLLCK